MVAVRFTRTLTFAIGTSFGRAKGWLDIQLRFSGFIYLPDSKELYAANLKKKTGPISRPHPNPQLKLNYQHIPIALRSDDIADSVVPAFVLCNRFERNILCI